MGSHPKLGLFLEGERGHIEGGYVTTWGLSIPKWGLYFERNKYCALFPTIYDFTIFSKTSEFLTTASFLFCQRTLLNSSRRQFCFLECKMMRFINLRLTINGQNLPAAATFATTTIWLNSKTKKGMDLLNSCVTLLLQSDARIITFQLLSFEGASFNPLKLACCVVISKLYFQHYGGRQNTNMTFAEKKCRV